MIPLRNTASASSADVGAKAWSLAAAQELGFAVPDGVVIRPDEPFSREDIEQAIGSGPFAVRSSATVEDGTDRSWAGQFTSVLPVSLADLPAAVAKVRGSASSARTRSYGGDPGPIPVLVQRLVPAAASGVGFSIDPRDGNDRRCVVEAVHGLGTAVTDGSLTPRRWTVPIAEAAHTADYSDTLDMVVRRHVVPLILSVAAWLGRPCDVEWAWDGATAWLLQARPVTAVGWRPAEGDWTSANLRDTNPGIVSPLSASIILFGELATAIDDVLRRLRLIGRRESIADVRLFYGRPYWRTDPIKERLLRLPGFEEKSFDDTLGIETDYAGQGRTTPVTARTLLRSLPQLDAAMRTYRSAGRAADRYADAFDRTEPEWLQVRWEELPDADLASHLDAVLDLHRNTNHHALTVTFLAEQAQDVLRQALAALRHSQLIDDRALLSVGGEFGAAEATRALDDLAREHREDAAKILAAHVVDELPPHVAADLQKVVDRFGWMAAGLDELTRPRWDEDTVSPLVNFQAAMRAVEANPALPGARARLQQSESHRRGHELLVRFSAGVWWPAVGALLRASQQYQRRRERMRTLSARANRILRRSLLEMGRRATRAGVLVDADEVFQLDSRQLELLRQGRLTPAAAERAVIARRSHGARFRNWEPPMTFSACSELPATEVSGVTMAGVAAASGVANGRAVVLNDTSQLASVEPGSVLVLRHGDPGWTPGFLLASALVVEECGLLSHAMVVARELRVPTVINVRNATQLIANGERVEVDGDRGVVVLQDRERAL